MGKLRLVPVIVCLLVLGLIGNGFGQVAQAQTTGKKELKAAASKETKAEKKAGTAEKNTKQGKKAVASEKKVKNKKLAASLKKKKTKTAAASTGIHKKKKVAKRSGEKHKTRNVAAKSKGKAKSHKEIAGSKGMKKAKAHNKHYARKNGKAKAHKHYARKNGKAKTVKIASRVRPISDYQPPSPMTSDLWLARECPDLYRQMANEEQPQDLTMMILESAYSCLGAPYRRGGSTPDGFDCSGFIRYVYKEHGIRLGRSSRDQAQDGRPVELTDLKPGDLIFFKMNQRRKTSSHIDHVGLYVGDGQFIHASSNPSTREIKVDSLEKSYYFPRIVGARRILDDEQMGISAEISY